MAIELTDKITPKNNAFVDIVDAKNVGGDGASTNALQADSVASNGANKVLRVHSGNSYIEAATLIGGTNVTITHGAGTITIDSASGSGSGTVTSVTLATTLSGLSVTGTNPITTSGTFTLSGTLNASSGGTGQSTYTVGNILYASTSSALSKLGPNNSTTKMMLTQTGFGSSSAAPVWESLDSILPTQTGNSGKVLGTDGSTASWVGNAISGLTSPYIPYASSSSTIATYSGGNAAYADSVTKSIRPSFYNASDGAYAGGTVVNYTTEVQTDASSTAEKVTTIRSGIGFGSPSDWIRFGGYYKFAANGNNKTIKLRLTNASNGDIDLTIASSTASAAVVYVQVFIFKPTSSSICTMGFIKSTASAVETVFDKTTTTGLTGSTTSWDIKSVIQTTTAGAAAGNVIQRCVTLEWGPAGG